MPSLSSAHTGRSLLVTVSVLLAAPPVVLAQFPVPFGPEFRVNTYTTGAQRRPSAAAYQGSGFVIVWEGASQDGDQSGIFAQQYDFFGTPLGSEFRVNTYTTGAQHSASVGSKRSQNFVIAWQSDGQDGDAGGTFARRWSAGGAPLGGEFQVNSYTTASQVDPAVATDTPGNFVIVWASLGQDGSGYGVFGQRFASTGAPLGAEFRVNTYTTGFQGHPAVGMDPDGYFVVVWEGEGADDPSLGIFAQRYLNTGAPLGGEFRVNTFTTGKQRYPSVDSDFGRFTVAWQSDGEDGSGYGVFSKPYTFFSLTPGPEFRVNDFTTGSQNHPSVRTNGTLDCAITWSDDAQGGIFAKTYYGCTGPLGPERLVNTYTSGIQNEPAVAVPGFPVVAWTSEQDPDGSTGVYAQRLQPGWLPVELQDFTVE